MVNGVDNRPVGTGFGCAGGRLNRLPKGLGEAGEVGCAVVLPNIPSPALGALEAVDALAPEA